MGKAIRQAGAKNPGWFGGSEPGAGAEDIPTAAHGPAQALDWANSQEVGQRPVFPGNPPVVDVLDEARFERWQDDPDLAAAVNGAANALTARDVAEAHECFALGTRLDDNTGWAAPFASHSQVANMFQYQAETLATETLDRELRDAGYGTDEMFAARDTEDYQAAHGALAGLYAEVMADAALEQCSGRVLIGNHADNEFYVAEVDAKQYARAVDTVGTDKPFPMMAVGFRLRYRTDESGNVVIDPRGGPERAVFTENLVIQPSDVVSPLGTDADGHPVVLSRDLSGEVVDVLPELDSERMAWSRDQSMIVLKNQMAARMR